MKKIIYCIGIIAIALSGCLKDEGDYDYLDVSQVEGIKGIDAMYSISKFEDLLEIDPEITFKNGGDETAYEYEWKLQYSVVYNDEFGLVQSEVKDIIISENKKLEFTADNEIPYEELFGTFTVRNKSTEVEFIKEFTLRVQNAYDYGYFFLCEKGDDSELFLIRENGATIPDLYTLLTGDVLAGKPLQMENVVSGIDQDLVIFTDGAPNYGTVIDFLKLDVKWGAIKCFHNEEIEVPFELNAFVVAEDIYTVINNQYYFTSQMLNGSYKPYIALDVPDLDEPISSIHAPRYDERFMHAVSGNIWLPGEWGALDKLTSGGSDVVIPGTCLFVGRQPRGSIYNSAGTTCHMFTKVGNELTETVLNGKIDWMSWKTKFTLKSQRSFVAPDLIMDDTKFVGSYSERYFYFTSANKIYRYNYDAPNDMPALIAELPADQSISYIYLDFYEEDGSSIKYDEKFVVATYDNSGEMNGSVYHLDMDGSVLKSYEHVCGKIVDLVVKE